MDVPLDGDGMTWGRAASFSPGTPQRGLTAEGLPVAFPAGRGINPSLRKAGLGAHHCVTTSSFPCLLLTSEICLYPYLHEKYFPFFRDMFPVASFHPALATLIHGSNAESQVLFVLKCTFLPPSSSSFPSFNSHRADSPALSLK